MQKLVEALKRKEREEAAKPKETAEAFRAKFAEIYGPKKNTAGNDSGTGQEAPGAGTQTGTPPNGEEAVQTNFDTNPGNPGQGEGENDTENDPERLPDNGEVPPDPAERTRMSQEREEGSGTDEDTPGTKKPVQARKSGNGKGKGKVRGKGKAGRGRKR